jgi:hypothetical protein
VLDNLPGSQLPPQLKNLALKIRNNLMFTSRNGNVLNAQQCYLLLQAPIVDVDTRPITPTPPTPVNSLKVKIKTGNKTYAWWRFDGAGTNDHVYFDIGRDGVMKAQRVDSPISDDFEANSDREYTLDPQGLNVEDIVRFELSKGYDINAHSNLMGDDAWLLDGVRITVNGQVVYDRQGIDTWLVNDESGRSTTWGDAIPRIKPPPTPGGLDHSIVNPPFNAYPVALTFDRARSYVSLGNSPALAVTGTITLQAWIRPKSTAGFQDILAHGYTGHPQAEVFLRINAGRYQVGSWDGTAYYAEYMVPAGDVDHWVYLCGTWDGSNWTLYRNGEQVAQKPARTGAIPVSADWAIGARGDGSERFAQACVREVSIWKRALSAADVVQYMQQCLTGSENGLASFWPLDEGAGPDVFDRAPNPVNGTLKNAGWVDTPSPPGWFLATQAGDFGGRGMMNPVVLTHERQLWAMAGAVNKGVYSSVDGVTWSCVTATAPWIRSGSGRLCAAGVVFRDRMWLLGGGGASSVYNDVWYSADGVNWTCATPAAGWAPRLLLRAKVFQGKIWVLGGSDGAGNPNQAIQYNDVWHSADGVNWTCALQSAPWSPRHGAGTAVFDGRLWLFGGVHKVDSIQDAWSSADGVTWTATHTPPWQARFSHNVEVVGNTLYLLGGLNRVTFKDVELGDVWSTRDGSTWEKIDATAPWSPHSLQGTSVFNDRIYLIGGSLNRVPNSACWYYVPRVPMRTADSGTGSRDHTEL